FGTVLRLRHPRQEGIAVDGDAAGSSPARGAGGRAVRPHEGGEEVDIREGFITAGDIRQGMTITHTDPAGDYTLVVTTVETEGDTVTVRGFDVDSPISDDSERWFTANRDSRQHRIGGALPAGFVRKGHHVRNVQESEQHFLSGLVTDVQMVPFEGDDLRVVLEVEDL